MRNRETYSANMRSIRAAEKRTPVEHAFFAVSALNQEQLFEFIARYNKVWSERYVELSAKVKK